MRLISVVIGAKSGQERFKESTTLLNFGFSNFTNKQLVSKQDKLSTANILHSKNKEVDVFAKEDFYVIDKKGTNGQYQCNVVINENLAAPISKEMPIGKVIVTKNGKVIKEIDVVTNCDISKITYFESIKKVTKNW